MKARIPSVRALLLLLLIPVLFISSCKRGPLRSNEVAYVAAPQVNLRDRVATVYNRVGTAKNGEKVEILERQKRFARVRTDAGLEGWVEERYLVGPDVFDGFQKLAADNKDTPVQSHGATRAELNMHITPGRDTARLYQLAEGEKVEILKRATAERLSKNQPSPAPSVASKTGPKSQPQTKAEISAKSAAASPPKPDQPKQFDDFWLVRNSAGRVGWVLARMVDLDVPLEIAQYSEGQRIVGAYVINKLQDSEKQVPQYLVVFSEAMDGMPFDYNQARVFTWNPKRDRYETAYRERGLMGFFPVTIGSENFGAEGVLPTFTLRALDQQGNIVNRKYKLNQPIVRRVVGPGEENQKLATPPKPGKASGRRRG